MKHRCIIGVMVLLILLLSSCATPNNYAGMNTPTTEDTPGSISPVQNAVKNYFDWQPPQNYFVVENYDDLQEVYAMAAELPDITEYINIEGDWRQAYEDNTYDREFFETDFVVIAMFKTDSMNNTFSYDVNDVNDSRIYITVSSIRPNPFAVHSGAYLLVIPIEGRYKGQQIQIVHTRTLETFPDT
ncbi:MAG: hypothetical protein IJY27_00745 [Clostridia bacterium]|nr:hypothetical protein [Clostridia bacterium]